jgi:soluble lytic murein transglycosylase-like protein
LKQKSVVLALVAAASGAVIGGMCHYVNEDATSKYAEVTRLPGYLIALQKTIEFVPRTIAGAISPPAPAPVRPPRVVRIYPDTPPLHLARGYVETNPGRYTHHIRHASQATKVPVALIRAVITAESAFNPYALSSTGAVGLMQLMPETAARYGVKDRLDPSQNILGGARYLSDLMRMFNNNMHLAIAAYNAGEGAVMKHGRRIPPYPETVAYVPKVLKYYKRYRLA